MTDDLDKMLRFDPLAAAEEFTGESYKEDEATMSLGFLTAIEHNQRKQATLSALGDTHFGITWNDAVKVFRHLGFEIAHGHRFAGNHDELDRFLVLWRPDGVLATLESYGDSVNSAKVHYNWHPRGDAWREFTSSGGFHRESYDAGKRVWVGDHDAREAVRHNLARMAENGEFLPAWVERPFLWLLDYSQTKVEGYDYRAINAQVISTLPSHVRDAITPDVSESTSRKTA